MQLDHSKTKVLLIGASEFPEDLTIDPIPNVKKNLQLLINCLSDMSLVGIPKKNILVSLNETKFKIEKRLRDIIEENQNKSHTIIIYYSGHGIMSARNYKLYLTTNETSKKYLENSGINIHDFKNYIQESLAGRKIIILDCCHSGYAHNAQGDFGSQLRSVINTFEGTYVMTSSAEDEPALFPEEKPEQPTYFTGRLVEIIENGLEDKGEYCSLRDIFTEVEKDFEKKHMPQPQQSIFRDADQIYFARNKKFVEHKPADEIAWEEAKKVNTVGTYLEFKNKFRDSIHSEVARQKIYDIEEDKQWKLSVQRNTVSAYDDYLNKFPDSRRAAEACEKIELILAKQKEIDEFINGIEETTGSNKFLEKEINRKRSGKLNRKKGEESKEQNEEEREKRLQGEERNRNEEELKRKKVKKSDLIVSEESDFRKRFLLVLFSGIATGGLFYWSSFNDSTSITSFAVVALIWTGYCFIGLLS